MILMQLIEMMNSEQIQITLYGDLLYDVLTLNKNMIVAPGTSITLVTYIPNGTKCFRISDHQKKVKCVVRNFIYQWGIHTKTSVVINT